MATVSSAILERALELFRSAAESGIVAAKVEAGDALINRRPIWNPRAGVSVVAGGGRSRIDPRANAACGDLQPRRDACNTERKDEGNQVRA